MGFTVLNALSICVEFNIWGWVLHSTAYCNFTRLCNTRWYSCNHSVKRLVCPGKGMAGRGGASPSWGFSCPGVLQHPQTSVKV